MTTLMMFMQWANYNYPSCDEETRYLIKRLQYQVTVTTYYKIAELFW